MLAALARVTTTAVRRVALAYVLSNVVAAMPACNVGFCCVGGSTRSGPLDCPANQGGDVSEIQGA
jgi:hypothetical protein